MEKVKDKLTRSENLLNNLKSENDRWEESSKTFKEQMASMPGDVLLCGAFLTYIGFFDHFYRGKLIAHWQKYLEKIGLKFRNELNFI